MGEYVNPETAGAVERLSAEVTGGFRNASGRVALATMEDLRIVLKELRDLAAANREWRATNATQARAHVTARSEDERWRNSRLGRLWLWLDYLDRIRRGDVFGDLAQEDER